jgi:putative transposase
MTLPRYDWTSHGFDYIEVFYNRQRRHSHLGGISPEGFEAASL